MDRLAGGLMRARHGGGVCHGHNDVLSHRRQLRRRSGSLLELALAIQAGRGDGWGSGRQTDRSEKRLNGRGLSEGGNALAVVWRSV